MAIIASLHNGLQPLQSGYVRSPDRGSHARLIPKKVSLVRPAFAREVWATRTAGGSPNVHVHVGATAWDRAKRRGVGDRIVVPLDLERSPGDYDFKVLDGLTVTVNAIDADLVLARQVAVAVVEQGAKLVVLLHPDLPKNSEFYYSVLA